MLEKVADVKTAFVRDLPQNLKAEDVKCENEAFLRDFPQNLNVKTQLSCENSFKISTAKL